METYTIQRDNDTYLQFTGKEIASVASTQDKFKGHWFSGHINEWIFHGLLKKIKAENLFRLIVTSPGLAP